MKDLLERLKVEFTAFEKEATSQEENNNKAAGTRARKSSLALEKLLKEFRKKSIEASK